MNEPVQFGVSILKLSKIVIYEFGMIMQSQTNKTTTKKAKLFYMDTESFVVDVKTGHIYKDIAEYAER